MTLSRRLAAEALGTALLLAVVVGSSIMAGRLAPGHAALALLANAIASATGLLALILAFGAISGAHLNPAVTLSDAWRGAMRWRAAALYVVAQVLGAFAGVAAAHVMFGEPVFASSTLVRTGAAFWWSEFVATFGLIGVIIGCTSSRPGLTPFAVAVYILSAYWFTASSSFANPALTLARAATGTVAGIRFEDVAGYVTAQLLGALAASAVFTWLYREFGTKSGARSVIRTSSEHF
ncbi:MAG: aquaporin family protein [Pseudoduganella sp.]|jgi:glycerol uptake facilitator-like aquaporin|nr:aquaporin family protein [Pseudoduganella sp.]